jgi:hypothetical protein
MLRFGNIEQKGYESFASYSRYRTLSSVRDSKSEWLEGLEVSRGHQRRWYTTGHGMIMPHEIVPQDDRLRQSRSGLRSGEDYMRLGYRHSEDGGADVDWFSILGMLLVKEHDGAVISLIRHSGSQRVLSS